MASPAESGDTTSTCLVCFEETAKLKTVGSCKHSFCFECLDKHLGSQPQGIEVFPCPSCQQECPKPSCGVEGLDDWSREVKTDDSIVSFGRSKQPCQVCEFKDTPGPCPNAEYRCEQCRDVLLCNMCAREHGAFATTSHHVVISLSVQTTGFSECSRHHKPLDLFCNLCQRPACSLCVLLEHREHDVVEMRGLIRNALDDTHDKIARGTTKLSELEQLRSETGAARDVILNWRGRMIQQVEEATERAINRLLEQKEKLKNEIKTGCDVSGMTDMLEKIPKMKESIQKELVRGRAILNETSLNHDFLSNLEKITKELDVVLESDDLERDLHWKKLREPLPLFEEHDSLKDIELGKVSRFSYNNLETTKITELVYNDTRFVIQSVVASAGQNDYALVPAILPAQATYFLVYDHSYQAGQPAKQKLVLHGVFDIAATKDIYSDLAVLHNVDIAGYAKESKALTVYSSNDGDHKGRLVCKNLANAVSLSVNILGQYVVLSNTTDDIQQITVLSRNGEEIDTFAENNHGLKRVACGGKYFYILGKTCIEMYEMMNGKVTFVNSFTLDEDADDITATPSDDVFVSISTPLKVEVHMVFSKGEYRNTGTLLLTNEHDERLTGESRVDITDSWIIVSHAHGWYLYKLKALPPKLKAHFLLSDRVSIAKRRLHKS